MPRGLVVFLAPALLLAAAGSVPAEEKAAPASGWVRRVLWPWPGWFGKKAPTEESQADRKSPPSAQTASAGKNAETGGEKDGDKEVPQAARSPGGRRVLAQNAWLRRLEVCDKLREVALRTGDDELARQAELLEQRVWDNYVLQTGGKSRPIEERILDRHLGVEASPLGERPIREVAPETTGADATSPRRKE